MTSAVRVHGGYAPSLSELLDDPPPNLVASLLAQLISDRCRDLSALAAAYRTALARPPGVLHQDGPAPDEF